MTRQGFKAAIATAVLAAAISAAAPAYAAFEGFGSDIPLESAARQIVPQGWTVDYAEGVDRQAEVSWGSAGDWKEALSDAVAARGYSAQFGSGTVVIVKSSMAPKTAPKAAPAEAPRPYASSPAPAKVQKAAAPAPRSVREEPYVGGGGFSIRPYRGSSAEGRMVGKGDFAPYGGNGACYSVDEGDMLRPALSAWAECAGWRLVWDSEYDYRIEASATFGGDFIDAVSSLAAAMDEARPAITVDFFKGNSVVVVSNKAADEVN